MPAFAQNPSPLLNVLAMSEGMEVQASSSGGAASNRIRQGNRRPHEFCFLVVALSLSHVRFFETPGGPRPARLLCPWDFPGKSAGVGCHFPAPGDLLNPGIEPVSPALAGDSSPLTHQGSFARTCFFWAPPSPTRDSQGAFRRGA